MFNIKYWINIYSLCIVILILKKPITLGNFPQYFLVSQKIKHIFMYNIDMYKNNMKKNKCNILGFTKNPIVNKSLYDCYSFIITNITYYNEYYLYHIIINYYKETYISIQNNCSKKNKYSLFFICSLINTFQYFYFKSDFLWQTKSAESGI